MGNKIFKKAVTLLLCFVVFIFLMIGCDILLFESDQPFLGFVGAIVTVLVIVWFPYEKIFKQFFNK